MRFPKTFTRTINVAGGIVLGSDSAPTGTPQSIVPKNNCQLSAALCNVNGFPIQRVVVGYHGPVGALPLSAVLWCYDDETGVWYQVGSAKLLQPEQLTWFDQPTIGAMGPRGQADQSGQAQMFNPGSLDLCLVVSAAGADPDGTYTFALGMDISNALGDNVAVTAVVDKTGLATAANQSAGTAGTPSAVVGSVQGVSGGTPVATGSRLARVAHRASAALPAAGAWTDVADTPAYTIPVGVSSITFACTYTRGAVGGYPYIQATLSNGTEPWTLPLVYHPDLTPSAAGAVVGQYTVAIPPGVTTIRLSAREMGVVATPGTLAIALVGGSGDGTIPESIRSCVVDFSCSTPNSATTALGTSSFDLGFLDLSNFENFKMIAVLAGTDGTASGGTIDTILHVSIDGVNWSEWLRYPQIASNAAAVVYSTNFALASSNVAVGRGVGTAMITPVIAVPTAPAVTWAGGHVGRGIRPQFVTGAGTNHSVPQTFRLVGTRKVAGY
jgi:hypothetical protein